jgi:hypothetical protein
MNQTLNPEAVSESRPHTMLAMYTPEVVWKSEPPRLVLRGKNGKTDDESIGAQAK